MSWDVFFSMQGPGPYLWGSFGLCFVLMALEVWSLRRRGDAQAPRAEEAA